MVNLELSKPPKPAPALPPLPPKTYLKIIIRISIFKDNNGISIFKDNNQTSIFKDNNRISILKDNDRISIFKDTDRISNLKAIVRILVRRVPKQENQYSYTNNIILHILATTLKKGNNKHPLRFRF